MLFLLLSKYISASRDMGLLNVNLDKDLYGQNVKLPLLLIDNSNEKRKKSIRKLPSSIPEQPNSLQKKIKKFDPYRTSEIHTSLNESYQSPFKSIYEIIPEDLSKIIGTFDYDKHSDDLKQKVMKKLLLIENEQKVFDFYNKNFPIQLLESMNSKKGILDTLKSTDSFWSNLARLVFKWILYVKNFQFDDKNEINLIMENQIKSISLMISERGELDFPLDFELKSTMCNYDFVKFKTLADCEFAEKSFIFEKFNLIIDDFYNPQEIEESKGENYYCDKLKNDHFNGNFDNDPLLKLLILLYDPQRRIIKECFPENQISFPLKSNLITDKNSIFLNGEILNGPKNLLMDNVNFMNSDIIKFFLKTKRTILIFGSSDLVNFLRIMKEAHLLKRDILEKIIKFKLDNKLEPSNWNQKSFLKCLNEKIDNDEISEMEYLEYLNLID